MAQKATNGGTSGAQTRTDRHGRRKRQRQLTNFAFIMVSKFVCPDVRAATSPPPATPSPPCVSHGNGGDKKDDKNDKKARLPKSEANVKASTATNQPHKHISIDNITTKKDNK